jgi:serine/threonine protein kinase/photosystem II stability/assembly factor-like uncharacterized protein
MANFIGQTIGGYRIVEQIGLGGMATVYKAYQPSMDRYVAFKIISTHLTQDPAFVKRFEQEAKVIARLEHLHILPVHDYGERDGCLYLVMRFIEGGTLKERIQGGPLSLDETRRVVTQVGSALEYAHQRGVIHRDLKPSNILIDPQGDCYLSDFGIAKMAEGTLGLTGSGVVGTPHYMAPEQGQSLKVDHRADIYAMGIVIYEMVTGRVPFDAETPFGVVLKHLTEPLPLPRVLRPDLPEEVERVILKALAKDPADRYQSMSDLVAAFERAASAAPSTPSVVAVSRPVASPPVASVASRSVQPQRRPTVAPRSIWPLAAVGAALLGLIVVGAVVVGLIASGLLIGGKRSAAPPAATVTSTSLTASTQPEDETGRNTPEVPPATVTAGEGSQPVAEPPPTVAKAQPTSPPPTLAPTPTGVPAKPVLPAGNWQPLPDLPRQINALVADPANPHVLYAGTGSSGAGSGVYKSEDAGLTWRLASTGLPSEDVKALAFSYQAPATLYAAVGQNVLASADGGASWSQLAKSVGNSRGFGQISVAPSDGKVLYGATVIEGAFRSDDGGRNWIAINQGLPKDNNGSYNVQAVAVDPTDPNIAYLGTGWGPSNGNGVYKSTDGGQSWSPANRGMIDYSVTALAVDPASPPTVYAGTYDGKLFRSVDGGQAWDNLTDKLPTASGAPRSTLRAIILDPAAPETVCVLGEREGVMVSTDGGEMWRLLGKPGKLDYLTFTALAAIFDPEPVLVAGIKGEGGWRYAANQAAQAPAASAQPPVGTPTREGAALATPPPLPSGSWQPIPDLPRQVNALAVDPTNPQTVYAGTGSSGAGSGVYKSEDAGRTWQLASNGLPKEDVRALAFSHGSPPTLYASAGARGDVFASVDGAQSWTQVGNYELTGFGGRLVVAPGNADLLFVAEDVRGTYRSLDGGRNWLPANQGLPKDSNGSHNVQSLAIDPTDPNVVYAGTGWGPFGGNGVYKSTDGGENWSPANRGMIDYSITALAIDPANPQTIYAGGNGGELFKSSDGGQTWDNLTAKLAVPSENSRSALRAILLDPAAPQTVYLLGEREGVMVSADGGGAWRLLGKPGNLGNPTFSALTAIFGQQPILIAGVRGEGGWRYSQD